MARKIDGAIRSLLLVGFEPEEITIDIDRRAVIIRKDSIIYLRCL